MAKRSSRTLKMMGEFMALHNAGHSIPEIAKMTGADLSVIYRLLDEIAKQNDVTRESLLAQPHSNYPKRGKSKMAIYRLKGKTMHELVKRGFTKADFCAKYQCTEDELVAQIRKILCDDNRAVNEIINEITVNEKRAAKSKPKTTETPTETAIPEETPASDIQPTTEVPTKEQNRDSRLAELKAEKERLMQQSDEAIKRYTEADKAFGKYSNRLKELDAQIKELETALISCGRQKEEFAKLCNEALAERTSAMKEREMFASQIADVSLEISELLAVQLIACDDGTIEAIDEPDFAINEEGANKYYDMLVHDPGCSEFRMKDVSLLARAMAIRKNSKDRRVVVTFENDLLTQYYARA